MSTRRRIGVSLATTEAARRQLMQPVPCWEKSWVVPDNAQPGSTLKVYKWIKTEKKQQFSDDEGEVDDEPLAPLPDEPEVVEGDEELDQDDPVVATGTAATPIDISEPAVPKEPQDSPSKPPSPKPHPLSMSLQPSSELTLDDSSSALDAALTPLESSIDIAVDVEEKLNSEGGVELDISGLGPDGTVFEGEQDLSQLDGSDALMGGPLLDESEDPFTGVAD